MAHGPLGAPRPLLSQQCFLVVRTYTAVPTRTITGELTENRRPEFRNAAESNLPVTEFIQEPHDIAPETFGDSFGAVLETDRLQMTQFMEFVSDYAELLGVRELRKLNLGIDTRVEDDSRIPRLFAEVDVLALPLLELEFPDFFDQNETDEVLHRLETELDWIVEIQLREDNVAVIQYQGGVNDLVILQILDMMDELDRFGLSLGNVTVTCQPFETRS